MVPKDDGKQEQCPLLNMIQSFPAAGKEEGGSVPFAVRLKLMLKRRLSVRAQKKIKRVIGSLLDLASRRSSPKPSEAVPDERPLMRLASGDWVRIRSKEQIEATLDRWQSLKGCGFMDGMASYCGTTQRVLKRVERFMDERDFRLKKASGVVLIEGLMCSGGGRCDRSCFYFWREEWLEKIDEPAEKSR